LFAGNFGLSPILHPFRRNSLLCSQKLPKITKGPQFLKFKVIKAPGRSARHHALNDLVARSFASAGVPVTKKPAGLFRSDGKRPDGVSLVSWQSGKSLCWDVTVTCPLAESYVDRASHQAGSAAELAATREEDKCVDLGARYIFEPIAIETLEFSTHQLASSWLILEEESQLILARLERPVICFRGLLFWCSASMLFCCTTVCRPLTARTDDRTHLCIS